MQPAFAARALLLALLVPACSVGSALACAWVVRAISPDQAIPVPPATVLVLSPLPGRALFLRSCAHCHGTDAHGNGEDSDGPDLHDLPISNARIAAIIHNGIHGEMPSFAKKHSAADIAALIAYLRTQH